MANHRHMPHSRLFAVLAAAALAVLTAGCGSATTQSPHPTPSPTSSASPTATASLQVPPTFSGTLGPPPSNCTVVPPPQMMTSTNFGGGFIGTSTFLGASPAWAFGMGDSPIIVSGTPYPGTKILWVVGPNYNRPVTLSGHDLRSGAPLWFDIYPNNFSGGSDVYTTSAVLNPSAPNRGSTTNSTGFWNIWGVGLIVEAASCFELDVSSQAGSWHTEFAAGAGP